MAAHVLPTESDTHRKIHTANVEYEVEAEAEDEAEVEIDFKFEFEVWVEDS